MGQPCLSVSLFADTFGSGDLRPVVRNFFRVLFLVSPEPDSKISNTDLSFKVISRGRPLFAHLNCPELELSRVEGGRGRGRPSVVPEMCPRLRVRGHMVEFTPWLPLWARRWIQLLSFIIQPVQSGCISPPESGIIFFAVNEGLLPRMTSSHVFELH